ncbi:poly(glycerol-phosphate) alpha-glucosyltransferase [Staphylococcus carnosus]|nr:poly(glycerol-phosphate) alpha-glucosyltransferase [Staphylococcus carnosus]ANZ34539.1 poly(glycerol-phosphate) alpha-glucosyltransferase [Staphylococcus carnosus]UTB84402.1 poly(glycerol-phosphate) alpha-glucosyltransferase [Staphylococcus carnosus]
MNITNEVEHILQKAEKDLLGRDYIFVSLGNPNMKATIKLLKHPSNIKRDIIKQYEQFKKKAGKFPEWIKIDFVYYLEEASFDDVRKELEDTRRNYVDFGIALDSNWNHAFMAEEININAFVRPTKDKKSFFLSEDNINNYLKKYTKQMNAFRHKDYEGKNITKFYTKGYFIEGNEVFELGAEGREKGLRKVTNLSKEIDKMIETSTKHLQNELEPNGKFNYGYFPHFDKKISFYNNLRHSSSTYAMIEGLNYLGEGVTVAEKAIDYIINNYLFEQSGVGHIFDDTKNINEIKLGQNAAFIFAVYEYLQIKPDHPEYLAAAQKVAEGILTMIDSETAQTVHVLNYPTLEVKEKFRVIYYDGEAALALLRLYQIDKNPRWLETVKAMFERFIHLKYWQYHDHWLGYCTNELIQIAPEQKYIEFGIRNVSSYLDYIKNRITTFPTFMEMLMATYHIIAKAREKGFGKVVDKLINVDELIDTIHTRANYQRTGYFYPELAMYFKNPERILGSFFIKHHGYRVRIDDIEHYVSGYVQYQQVFKEENNS